MTPQDDLFAQWVSLWIPPKRLQLADWAENNFVLSGEYAARSGKLRLYGYQRDPFNAFTDPTVTDIVFKVGTQVIKTLFIQVAMAYVAAEDPGPVLISQPTENDAEQFSKERLAPMVRDIPALHGRIDSSSSRRSSNTTLYKEFPGGSWSVVGAGAPANAARRSIRYLFCDEVNEYRAPPGNRGNFTDLAEERTSTFRSRAKRVFCCSPTIPEGTISLKYEGSDQRKPWAACWACGHRQILVWNQVKWDSGLAYEDRPESAYYQCINCDEHWNDLQRWTAANESAWVASRPFRGVAGFWINHLYSPDKTLAQMVGKWLKLVEVNDTQGIIAFKNTNLAEEWIERGDAPEWKRLYERSRQETWARGTVPLGGLFLMAGVDVQKNRLEASIYAHGRNRETWLVDHLILEGEPERAEVWKRLTDEVLNGLYPHDLGCNMHIDKMAVDSGAYTHSVYQWARGVSDPRVIVTKGVPKAEKLVSEAHFVDVNINGRRLKNGMSIRIVSVDNFRDEFYGNLRVEYPDEGEEFPVGFCHYPDWTDQEFFKQLVAEVKVTRMVSGRAKQEFVNTRDRNETHDTKILTMAAWSVSTLHRAPSQRFALRERSLLPEEEARPYVPVSEPVIAPAVFIPEPVQQQSARPSTQQYYQPVKSRFMGR